MKLNIKNKYYILISILIFFLFSYSTSGQYRSYSSPLVQYKYAPKYYAKEKNNFDYSRIFIFKPKRIVGCKYDCFILLNSDTNIIVNNGVSKVIKLFMNKKDIIQKNLC